MPLHVDDTCLTVGQPVDGGAERRPYHMYLHYIHTQILVNERATGA